MNYGTGQTRHKLFRYGTFDFCLLARQVAEFNNLDDAFFRLTDSYGIRHDLLPKNYSTVQKRFFAERITVQI